MHHISGAEWLFFPPHIPALILHLLREKSFLVSSTGFISKDMKEGQNHREKKPQQLAELWPRKGQDMRHIPQSAFWEVMLGVTAWSAQQRKKGKKDILGI